MTTTDAARSLGVTTQTIRNWVHLGTLKAERRGRSFWIDPDDVAALKLSRPGSESPTSSPPSAEVDAQPGHAVELQRRLDVVEHERDRYRAELVAAREAALLVSAANEELEAALRKTLDALALQRQAAGQLLAPAAPTT